MKDSELVLASYLHWVKDNLLRVLQLRRSFKGIASESFFVELDMSMNSCPLCKEYITGFVIGISVPSCSVCPIVSDTNALYCKNTPYTLVYIAQRANWTWDILIKAIWAECVYLKGLYYKCKEREAIDGLTTK